MIKIFTAFSLREPKSKKPGTKHVWDNQKVVVKQITCGVDNVNLNAELEACNHFPTV